MMVQAHKYCSQNRKGNDLRVRIHIYWVEEEKEDGERVKKGFRK